MWSFDEEKKRFDANCEKTIDSLGDDRALAIIHEVNDLLEVAARYKRPLFPILVRGSLSKYENMILASKKPTKSSRSSDPTPEPTPEVPEGEQDETDKLIIEFCSAQADTYTITIYVDQPVPGEPNASTVGGDVGHTFIKLEGGGKSLTLGWYPGDGGIGATNFLDDTYDDDQSGDMVDDSESGENDTFHDWDVKKSWTVSAKNLAKIKECIKKWKREKKYNLITSNCTDFALYAAKCGGIKVPNGRGPWPYPYDDTTTANPGKLGEELMGQGGERNND